MSTLIPFAGLATVPWKNGSGSTTEIAIDPPDGDFDNFNWRISLATISENGPFSIFPGVERTLALVDGNGMTLDIDVDDRVHVGQDEPVLAFSGDSEVEATLNRGPSVDFNVMTRSETCYHLFDPMCGSGTILVEAAQMVQGIPPGARRQFAFEKFHEIGRASCRERV